MPPFDGVREDPPDRRSDHEAVAAEAGREVEPFVARDSAEDRLPVPE